MTSTKVNVTNIVDNAPVPRYVKIFYPWMSVTWLRYTQTNAGIEYGKKDASSPVASATKSSVKIVIRPLEHRNVQE